MVKESDNVFLNKLFDFINESVTPAHMVSYTREMLLNNGFEELRPDAEWLPEEGGRYFSVLFGSALIAFTIPEVLISDKNNLPKLKIIGTHTDSPCLKIKNDPERNQSGNYLLNTEVYGSMIMNTWFDRPLSIAGSVMIQSEDGSIETEMVNFSQPVAIIPNLCIHHNREANEGKHIDAQKELLPLVGLFESEWLLSTELAKELEIDEEQIVNYDLYLYNSEDKATFVGMNQNLISAPRLDNGASCCAALDALIANTQRNRITPDPVYDELTMMKRLTSIKNTINVLVMFDNEEVGSRTKQGADSSLLSFCLEKIAIGIGLNRQQFLNMILSGQMISADAAHAAHPNYPDRSDLTNRVQLNQGPALKISASQSYASDPEMIAAIELLCREYNIQYSKYYNNSNIRGGSTIGPISSSLVPMRTLDIGVPMLAMHSACELIHSDSYLEFLKLLYVFYD